MCNLSIASWNIDGIFHRLDNERCCKLDDKTVIEKISKFDIIGLIETHCGPQDHLFLEDYYTFQINRKKSPRARKFSGGIALFIKQSLRKGIKILPINHTEYIWIKLDKNYFNFDNNIYIAFTYISPLSSSFSGKNDDIYELLENDISQFSSDGHCMLLGDFNAKTNTDADYILDNIPDDSACDILACCIVIN